jgi:hypothetical protein
MISQSAKQGKSDHIYYTLLWQVLSFGVPSILLSQTGMF